MRVVPAQLLVGAWLLSGLAAAQEGARSFGDEEAPEEEKVGVLTKAPVLVEFAEAAYPAEAVEEGLTASVELIITIDVDGSVSEAVLAGAPVGSGFDESAIEAAQRLRFEPAEIDGQPAAIRVPYVYRFEFQPPPEPEPEAVPEAAPLPKGRLIGRVRQKGTGVPIGGAELIVEPLEMAIYADARGRFESDVPPGSYVVVVRAPDHREQRIDVEIAHNEEVELVALIPPRFGVPSDVVIRGKRQQTSLTRRTLEGEQLQSVPGSFGDPLRAIQNLPGITRPPFVLGVLLVRGSAPGDSAVFVDGHEIPLIYHFLGGPSILAPDFLASIDFYPGRATSARGTAGRSAGSWMSRPGPAIPSAGGGRRTSTSSTPARTRRAPSARTRRSHSVSVAATSTRSSGARRRPVIRRSRSSCRSTTTTRPGRTTG
jgi:TonB family protein